MDINFINRKTLEYAYRMNASYLARDYAAAKKYAGISLVCSDSSPEPPAIKLKNLKQTIRSIKRNKKRLSQNGIEIPIADARMKKLQEDLDAAEADLAGVGEAMHYTLESWQSRKGATFEELCNLCNRHPDEVKERIKKIEPEPEKVSLSKLATVFNLDYKDPRNTGWLEDYIDAPLTHALKAYLLDTMLNTSEGRKASHEALEKFFPELLENALTETTDADGNRCLINKDGEVVAILGEEHGYEK